MRFLPAALLLSVSLASAHDAVRPAPPELPPVPSGVTELRFAEFFKLPVGRFGLEPTEKLLSLDGREVRLVGYMVQQDNPVPGLIIVAPYRMTIAEGADGMADDLPPSVAFIQLSAPDADRTLPYTPQPLLIEGRLSVGAKEETDGRVSWVRVSVSSLSTGAKKP